MSCPKEEHDELSTLAGSFSPKSFLSVDSLDSFEEPKLESSGSMREDDSVYDRVMEWFADKHIERGDPGSILDDYLRHKRQQVAASLNLTSSPSEQTSEKKEKPKLRRPMNLKISVQVAN